MNRSNSSAVVERRFVACFVWITAMPEGAAMNAEKRNRIRTTVRTLAEAHTVMIEVMEQAMTLLNEELALDALTFWKKNGNSTANSDCSANLKVDHALLRVIY